MMTLVKSGITINVPAFTVFEATLNTQVKSAERNGDGMLLRETLPDKWSLQMEWEFKTPEEFYAWFNVLKDLTRVNFVVNFPAPTGKVEKATFYVSPISAKMLNFSRGVSGWWKTMKCNFVEV